MEHFCPFCQAPFQTEEILFMHLREEKGHETKEDEGPGLQPVGARGPMRSFYAAQEDEAASEPEKNVRQVAEFYEDTLYNTKLNEFQYATTVRRLQKTIQWKDAAGYGVDMKGVNEEKIPQLIVDGEGEGYGHIICPNCHCELPEGYLAADDEHRLVTVMVGGSQSGKTQYLVSFLQAVESALNTLRLGTVKIAPASMHFYEAMQKQLKDDHAIEATQRDKPIFPIVLTIGHPTNPNEAPYFITLFDCAGEAIKDSQYAFKHEGLKNARAVMLFVDPAVVFGHGVLDDETIRARNFCEEPMGTTLQSIHRLGMCKGVTDVVAVLTKLDILINHALKNKSDQYIDMKDGVRPLVTSPDILVHEDRVDMETMRIISREVEIIIERKNMNSHRFTEMIHNYFPVKNLRVSYAGVSTYVWDASDPAGLMKPHFEGDMGRHRIVEPVLYLLGRIGAVEVSGAEEIAVEEVPAKKGKRVFSFGKGRK